MARPKSTALCAVADCGLPIRALGLCNKHWQRQYNTGTLNPRRMPSLEERFWSKVDKTPGLGPRGDCWEWTGGRLSAGYGTFWVKERGSNRGAHVVGWELQYGPVPAGQDVLHRCDNPPCVRHLFLGTQADNMADMQAKGRAQYPGPNTPARGPAKPNAKLTEADVVAIRLLLAEGVRQSEIGRRFGVTHGAISRIRRGLNWSYLPHTILGALQSNAKDLPTCSD